MSLRRNDIMQNTEAIWLINKDNHAALGKLNTLPRIGERLIYQTSDSMYELEYEVRMVLHCPRENAICVFAEPVQSEYSQILHSINWNP